MLLLGMMAIGAMAFAEPARPDIVVVVVDDLDLASLHRLEGLMDVLEEGTELTRAFVSSPLCCPSRASTLTGLYQHNTGVYNNEPEGAFLAFEGDMEGQTIAVALQEAGYRTGLFGKYLNGYAPRSRRRYVPVGWTTWAAATSAGRG
ncbi:MAG: sulfatase-like hydrolase/transferase, partial [Proteobacteria bacterium]|nr:sulfatase-like hydrolase/transferase [Pseudomonadota bacterium]